MEQSQAVIIGNYVTELHNILNGYYVNSKERNKALRKIVNRIYQAGYSEGCQTM